ncbi:hypothetical protein HDU76_001676 [Blyttiomyces sp. JEL0837]|nr:hypothetical protein HDU76_001676 [Blyttiomyces sp. JEL0837]
MPPSLPIMPPPVSAPRREVTHVSRIIHSFPPPISPTYQHQHRQRLVLPPPVPTSPSRQYVHHALPSLMQPNSSEPKRQPQITAINQSSITQSQKDNNTQYTPARLMMKRPIDSLLDIAPSAPTSPTGQTAMSSPSSSPFSVTQILASSPADQPTNLIKTKSPALTPPPIPQPTSPDQQSANPPVPDLKRRRRSSSMSSSSTGSTLTTASPINTPSKKKISNKRAQQNREAQRNFRERRKQYVLALEAQVVRLEKLLNERIAADKNRDKSNKCLPLPPSPSPSPSLLTLVPLHPSQTVPLVKFRRRRTSVKLTSVGSLCPGKIKTVQTKL